MLCRKCAAFFGEIQWSLLSGHFFLLVVTRDAQCAASLFSLCSVCLSAVPAVLPVDSTHDSFLCSFPVVYPSAQRHFCPNFDLFPGDEEGQSIGDTNSSARK